jgi:hypothetical protein
LLGSTERYYAGVEYKAGSPEAVRIEKFLKRGLTMNASIPPWAIRPLVAEEVYTDRQEPLEFFYQAALRAITRRTTSTVLLGRRRMGKTEIFKRVVNRLFFAQQEYADPPASVVPVYYSFGDKPIDRWEFSVQYTENFIRWYTAFRLRNLDALDRNRVPSAQLVDYVRSNLKETGHFLDSLTFFQALQHKGVVEPEKWSLMLPRNVSDRDESTIAVFLDEFQNTRLPQFGFDIVGDFHETVESPTCPHFVTGSAVSILVKEILGRGSLFGRFDAERIDPLTEYWGAELAHKVAAYYQTALPAAMAPVVAARCGENPFYISAVVRQAAKRGKPLDDETVLDETLAVDLSSGFIWGELHDQVNRWIERLNGYGVTRWVLYLSALGEEDKIDLERIRRELWERDRQDVPLATIRDVLIKLSRGDLLEYAEFGNWFRKTDDPILLDFLRIWGRIEVESQPRALVQQDLLARYQARERLILDHLGYLAEVYMAQVLWNGQRQTLPGRWFHSPEDVTMPWRFVYIWHRVRLGAGEGMELDIEAAAGVEVWIGESKWQRQRPAGRAEVETLLQKAARVRQKQGPLLQTLRVWFFSHSGFTVEATALMQQHGVWWSAREDLDALLTLVGLRRLPEL